MQLVAQLLRLWSFKRTSGSVNSLWWPNFFTGLSFIYDYYKLQFGMVSELNLRLIVGLEKFVLPSFCRSGCPNVKDIAGGKKLRLQSTLDSRASLHSLPCRPHWEYWPRLLLWIMAPLSQVDFTPMPFSSGWMALSVNCKGVNQSQYIAPALQLCHYMPPEGEEQPWTAQPPPPFSPALSSWRQMSKMFFYRPCQWNWECHGRK